MRKNEIMNLLKGIDENTDLYRKVNLIDMPSNSFNHEDYYDLLFRGMHLYHRLYGIESLIKNVKFALPIHIDKNVTFDEFMNYINELRNYELKIEILPNVKNHADNIIRLAAGKVIRLDDWSWSKIYSENFTGVEEKVDGKMYLSVDNEHLYWFAIKLFEGCLKNGILDFCFKVNNNESKTRSDSVVIYFNEENYGKYLELINQIIMENPGIKFNRQNVLAYPINDYVRIAKDPSSTSFTDYFCKVIMKLKKEGYNDEEIATIVKLEIEIFLADLLKLEVPGIYKK